jgi:hypothetical protein
LGVAQNADEGLLTRATFVHSRYDQRVLADNIASGRLVREVMASANIISR